LWWWGVGGVRGVGEGGEGGWEEGEAGVLGAEIGGGGGGFLLWDWRASHEGFYFDVVSCVDGALKAGVVVTFAAIVALPQ